MFSLGRPCVWLEHPLTEIHLDQKNFGKKIWCKNFGGKNWCKKVGEKIWDKKILGQKDLAQKQIG